MVLEFDNMKDAGAVYAWTFGECESSRNDLFVGFHEFFRAAADRREHRMAVRHSRRGHAGQGSEVITPIRSDNSSNSSPVSPRARLVRPEPTRPARPNTSPDGS
jgi:hypothetical protein